MAISVQLQTINFWTFKIYFSMNNIELKYFSNDQNEIMQYIWFWICYCWQIVHFFQFGYFVNCIKAKVVLAVINRIKDYYFWNIFLSGFEKQGSWSLHSLTPVNNTKANLQQLFFFKCGKKYWLWIGMWWGEHWSWDHNSIFL